jgi:hypothetical protein
MVSGSCRSEGSLNHGASRKPRASCLRSAPRPRSARGSVMKAIERNRSGGTHRKTYPQGSKPNRKRSTHPADGRGEFRARGRTSAGGHVPQNALLKVNTAEKRSRYDNGGWTEEPLALAFLKVICPSTQKTYFLRVDPDAETAKQALESTLPRYDRDWERDLVKET